MYRLFHEVNSLVTMADAHADSERRAKEFLRDTISDISNQLKPPIAALNIYKVPGRAAERPGAGTVPRASAQPALRRTDLGGWA